MPNGRIQHTDHTAARKFEPIGRNIITVQPWQCPKCLERFGVKGKDSAHVKVITARGRDTWCMKCFRKGEKEGICIKEEKLSRKKLKKVAPLCKNCGKKLIPVKDPKLKIYTGYLWRCTCMKKKFIISIG